MPPAVDDRTTGISPAIFLSVSSIDTASPAASLARDMTALFSRTSKPAWPEITACAVSILPPRAAITNIIKDVYTRLSLTSTPLLFIISTSCIFSRYEALTCLISGLLLLIMSLTSFNSAVLTAALTVSGIILTGFKIKGFNSEYVKSAFERAAPVIVSATLLAEDILFVKP
ncbi:MAG: hypothetical protein BWY84_01135 [Candidatus Aerophobetes bacterium ADurb.Bin490]|nr:MAG: hypothetical protein BWY84_01135 [Candidatus Aerophobetes bacterium ADurb.Bin490]